MISLSIIAGVVLLIVLSRKRKNRPRGPSRAVTTRTVSARNTNVKSPEQLEKDRRKIAADYNRRIKADLEKRQAADDIIHLQQRKADLLKAYEQLPDANSEQIIKRRIAYDNAIRSTEKQIEKAYMILHRTY